ncbi:MAG: hypothetical protein ACYDDO_12815 [Acidiferrobacterales bacterium]
MTLKRFMPLVVLLMAFGTASAAVEPSSPTPEQKQRLDQFGYEVFQTNLSDLMDQSGEVSERALVERFGRPLRRFSELGRHDDPQAELPSATQWTTWYFRGLALEMSHAPSMRSGLQSGPLVIVGVSVTSPDYVLKHGLRVGEARSRFITVLGPPTYQDRQRVRYDVENAARVSPDEFDVAPYQIEMDLDANDRVRRIVWSWWSD